MIRISDRPGVAGRQRRVYTSVAAPRVSRECPLRAPDWPRPLCGERGSRSEWLATCQKRGCGRCQHFGLRTGAAHRPDRLGLAMFLDFPLIAGAGMRFESHLGHVFPGEGPLLASDLEDGVHVCPEDRFDGCLSRRVCRWPFLWPVPSFFERRGFLLLNASWDRLTGST